MSSKTYLVAISKPWVLDAFLALRPSLPGNWSIVGTAGDLNAMLAATRPRYIFFPHWSERVPDVVIRQFECVCFHMTDLPFGRGGSPLQNLIASGHEETTLTALRMTGEMDAGPVYGKRLLSLEGSASEIFERAAPLVCELISWIVDKEPEPQPQEGTISTFKRRTPEQSIVPENADARELYDHIRMVDAPGYPPAFLKHGQWRLEFDQAKRMDDEVEARVRFRRDGDAR